MTAVTEWMPPSANSFEVVVAGVETLAPRVKQFQLVARSGEALPAFSPGSHILVTMNDGSRTIHNAYSLMGSYKDLTSYRISVLHTDGSRGGSRFLHERVKAGSTVRISHPCNLFPMQQQARKHLLIAGGIGITPFLSMMEQMADHGSRFELHYSMRDEQSGALWRELLAMYPASVHCYHTGAGARMPVARILASQPLGTHLYVCGPQRIIDDLMLQAINAGWPEEHVHAERFSAGTGRQRWESFEVELARSQRVIRVGHEETLLEAIEAAGIDAPYLCRGGACGRCETVVLGAGCSLLHQDHYLSAQERKMGEKIMICVSRATGGRLVLDL